MAPWHEFTLQTIAQHNGVQFAPCVSCAFCHHALGAPGVWINRTCSSQFSMTGGSTRRVILWLNERPSSFQLLRFTQLLVQWISNTAFNINDKMAFDQTIKPGEWTVLPQNFQLHFECQEQPKTETAEEGLPLSLCYHQCCWVCVSGLSGVSANKACGLIPLYPPLPQVFVCSMLKEIFSKRFWKNNSSTFVPFSNRPEGRGWIHRCNSKH